jgi:hypothetical protein
MFLKMTPAAVPVIAKKMKPKRIVKGDWSAIIANWFTRNAGIKPDSKFKPRESPRQYLRE